MTARESEIKSHTGKRNAVYMRRNWKDEEDGREVGSRGEGGEKREVKYIGTERGTRFCGISHVENSLSLSLQWIDRDREGQRSSYVVCNKEHSRLSLSQSKLILLHPT